MAPAGVALKARLMGTFTHSISAANQFPLTLQCVFDCISGKHVKTNSEDSKITEKSDCNSSCFVFILPLPAMIPSNKCEVFSGIGTHKVVVGSIGAGTTSRLKQAGMEFSVWIFKHVRFNSELIVSEAALVAGS